MQVVALCLLVFVFVAGCGSLYELYAVPGTTVNPPLTGYQDPDRYKVEPSAYPRFRAKREFMPPAPRLGEFTFSTKMVAITPADIWTVTHRAGERLVVYSNSYQERLRKNAPPREEIVGPYLFHLFIAPDGTVDRGWLLLRNPKTFIFANDRHVPIDPVLSASSGWPQEPLFEPQGSALAK